MDNTRLNPAFDKIVGDFMKLSAYAPAPAANPAEVATYRVPTDTGELAQLMGDVYRDAYASGYSDGYDAGVLQGTEDAERAADATHNERMHEQIVRYGEMWGVAYAADNDIQCLIRQFDELSPIQITATLRGIANRLQSQMIKGDK
jgi:hypothetical protein